VIKLTAPRSEKKVKLVFKRAGQLMEKTLSPKVGIEKQQHILRELPQLSEQQIQLRKWLLGENAFPVE